MQEVADYSCVYRNEVHHTASERTQVLQDVAADPTLPRTKAVKCSKCNHPEAAFFQVRSISPILLLRMQDFPTLGKCSPVVMYIDVLIGYFLFVASVKDKEHLEISFLLLMLTRYGAQCLQAASRGEEGMTLFFVCCNPSCGHRWRES
ncbi:unnamed protein product [Musa acuminata subsp. burmannicoides]